MCGDSLDTRLRSGTDPLGRRNGFLRGPRLETVVSTPRDRGLYTKRPWSPRQETAVFTPRDRGLLKRRCREEAAVAAIPDARARILSESGGVVRTPDFPVLLCRGGSVPRGDAGLSAGGKGNGRRLVL